MSSVSNAEEQLAAHEKVMDIFAKNGKAPFPELSEDDQRGLLVNWYLFHGQKTLLSDSEKEVVSVETANELDADLRAYYGLNVLEQDNEDYIDALYRFRVPAEDPIIKFIVANKTNLALEAEGVKRRLSSDQLKNPRIYASTYNSILEKEFGSGKHYLVFGNTVLLRGQSYSREALKKYLIEEIDKSPLPVYAPTEHIGSAPGFPAYLRDKELRYLGLPEDLIRQNRAKRPK